MTEPKRITEVVLSEALAQGADMAQCRSHVVQRTELNVRSGEMNLLRSTEERETRLVLYSGGAKGVEVAGGLDADGLGSFVASALERTQGAKPDEAYAMAPLQAPRSFRRGPREPDLDALHRRLEEFVAECRGRYPDVHLEHAELCHIGSCGVFRNTHGVFFDTCAGHYEFGVLFSPQSEKSVGSFNHSGAVLSTLDQPLLEYGSVARLMQEAEDRGPATPVEDTFVGDVIITPECLGEFLWYLSEHLADFQMIEGTSLFQDALGTAVAPTGFTLSSCPVDRSFAVNDFITSEGFASENTVLIHDGVLVSHLLSLYGARKTGKSRAGSSGSFFVLEGGGESTDELVAGVERGVLLNRFSGGAPAVNGDFSGVAKNSWLIEGGRITRAIDETMIAGNLADLFKSITGISRERVDTGASRLPWVRTGGMTISGS